jgi:type II secretory pathway pseudopilin PulG
MKRNHRAAPGVSCPRAAFTLAEILISVALAALGIAGIVSGYIMAAQRAEWAGYSLAAHALAMERIEQARAAKWDTLANPPVDELVSGNFPTVVLPLSIPSAGTNIVYATNITTITVVSTSPPLKTIQVDCIWPFRLRGVYTNTILTYRGPDE